MKAALEAEFTQKMAEALEKKEYNVKQELEIEHQKSIEEKLKSAEEKFKVKMKEEHKIQMENLEKQKEAEAKDAIAVLEQEHTSKLEGNFVWLVIHADPVSRLNKSMSITPNSYVIKGCITNIFLLIYSLQLYLMTTLQTFWCTVILFGNECTLVSLVEY